MALRHHEWWDPWNRGVYTLAHLPSIIYLGRLCIASRYIFSLWHLRQGVISLAHWLEYWIFIRADRVRIPRKAVKFFSYASFLCYDFHVIRTLVRREAKPIETVACPISTVNSRYLEFQGTHWNTSRYPYLDISELREWGKQ